MPFLLRVWVVTVADGRVILHPVAARDQYAESVIGVGGNGATTGLRLGKN